MFILKIQKLLCTIREHRPCQLTLHAANTLMGYVEQKAQLLHRDRTMRYVDKFVPRFTRYASYN